MQIRNIFSGKFCRFVVFMYFCKQKNSNTIKKEKRMTPIVINTIIGCGIPALIAIATLIYARYEERQSVAK